ncbi:NAD(P)H-dependent oxidoreductase [Gracilimonas mengyeensis]|uniref:NADPH-quinone reductase (Modulator of drug activity B) n=1 Tax=Gracilimonas mengyeensis TaxID=1302730 RepID=A0A521C0X9_9BACT|nr:NAD(P)H-dependent oxidoreductase [Gracilimonas mengyeensis]SMO53107.1 Putative NADPH-quinone reductase (modulator of drug activity B) [Gracilimonas mengyeensis]
MKNILIINGHPSPDSYNHALAEAYKTGALEAGAGIQQIEVGKLDFDPNLKFGYKKRMELEPDLQEAREKIKQADHLVWVHPVWWGGLPALLKGFIDRIFLPGFAFKYREDSPWWDKYLKGKTARIITTMDQPGWFYRLFFGSPSIKALKKSTLQFCGIKPVRVSYVGSIKASDEKQREKWLSKMYRLGKKQK